MNENECEVDEVRYVAKEGMATSRCMGCAAEGDTELCSNLDSCSHRQDRRCIIWIKADANQEDQGFDGGATRANVQCVYEGICAGRGKSDMDIIAEQADAIDQARLSLAVSLIDGAYELVELYHPETPANVDWRDNWLAKARALGAGGE